MQDPYKILETKSTATDAEIKKAFIELKNKYDPDNYEKPNLKQIASEKTKEIEEQAVHEAMRGMAIRTHQEEQYNNGAEMQGGSQMPPMSENMPGGEMPPIPEGPYNDADYAMPPVDENGYVPEMELPQAENIIFGKASRAKEKKPK